MTYDEVPCKNHGCAAKNICGRKMNKGKTYRCASALADAYGVTKGAVYQALSRTGSTDCLGQPSHGGGARGVSIRLGRYYWPSITAMARDLGMKRSTVDKKVRRDPQSLLAIVIRVKG